MSLIINPWAGIGGGYFEPANYLAAPLSASASASNNPWWMPHQASGAGGVFQAMAVPMFLNDMLSYRDPNRSWLASGLSGALSGAAAGSMFSAPYGPAIGAGLGYISGKK